MPKEEEECILCGHEAKYTVSLSFEVKEKIDIGETLTVDKAKFAVCENCRGDVEDDVKPLIRKWSPELKNKGKQTRLVED
jgi:3-dehydroquinate dehydratase